MRHPQQLDVDAVDLIPTHFRQNLKDRMVVMRLVTAGGSYDVPLRVAHAAALATALRESAR